MDFSYACNIVTISYLSCTHANIWAHIIINFQVIW